MGLSRPVMGLLYLKSVCVLLKIFMICLPFEVILCFYFYNFASLWKQINVLYQVDYDVCDGFCWL